MLKKRRKVSADIYITHKDTGVPLCIFAVAPFVGARVKVAESRNTRYGILSHPSRVRELKI